MLALHTSQGRAKLIQAESTLQPNEVGYIHLGYLLDGEQFPFHDLPRVTAKEKSPWTGIVFRSTFEERVLTPNARKQQRRLDSLL
jgi:hypothetical protein